jgi:hypothetical protein
LRIPGSGRAPLTATIWLAVMNATSKHPALAIAATARLGLALAAACLCQLMVVLDISVVNVALPHIDGALGFTPSSLSWVISAYTRALGACFGHGEPVPCLRNAFFDRRS